MDRTTSVVAVPDGRELCVESSGDPSGTAVLVLEGTPNSRHLSAKAVADAERRGIHLLSYDRPGYGRSTPRPGGSVADCVDDVGAIAEWFGIERLAVWGISGGGPFTLACAALLPDLVTRAASLASLAPYDAPDLDYFAGMGQLNVDELRLILDDRSAARERMADEREEALAMTPEQLMDSWSSLLSEVDLAAADGDEAVEITNSVKDGLAPGIQGWWDETLALIDPWGFAVEDIQIPVQVWHGVEDRFVPFQHGEWLASHIPEAEAHLSEDDGHITLTRHIPEIHTWLIDHD
jgi:pimeloyl-ACP methyl ester carboxylesterase